MRREGELQNRAELFPPLKYMIEAINTQNRLNVNNKLISTSTDYNILHLPGCYCQ